MFTNSGKSGTALLWGPSGTRPDYVAIGSGSGAVAVTNTDLVAEVFGVAFTSEFIGSSQFWETQADFNSVQMSGIGLKEFGVKVSGLNVWNREGFANIDFDGTLELQIKTKWETFLRGKLIWQQKMNGQS